MKMRGWIEMKTWNWKLINGNESTQAASEENSNVCEPWFVSTDRVMINLLEILKSERTWFIENHRLVAHGSCTFYQTMGRNSPPRELNWMFLIHTKVPSLTKFQDIPCTNVMVTTSRCSQPIKQFGTCNVKPSSSNL